MTFKFHDNCMEDYSFLTLTLENEDEWERKQQLYREKIKQYSKVHSYNFGGTEQEVVLSIAKYYGFIDPMVSSCNEIGEDLEFVLYDVGETDEYIQYLCNIGKDPKKTKEYKRSELETDRYIEYAKEKGYIPENVSSIKEALKYDGYIIACMKYGAEHMGEKEN